MVTFYNLPKSQDEGEEKRKKDLCSTKQATHEGRKRERKNHGEIGRERKGERGKYIMIQRETETERKRQKSEPKIRGPRVKSQR